MLGEDAKRTLAAYELRRQASGEDAIVLLSPASASFDQFPDFEARGEAFRAAVNSLTTPKKSRAQSGAA